MNNENMNDMNNQSNNVNMNNQPNNVNMNNQPMNFSNGNNYNPALAGFNNPSMNNTNQSMNNMNQPMNNMNQPMNNMNPPMNNMNQPMDNMNQTPTNPPTNNNSNKKAINPLMIVIPVVIILVVIIAVLLITGGPNNYKQPIKYYCQGMNDLNIDTLKKAFPKEIINNEENVEYIENSIKLLKETMDSNNGSFSVKCDIEDGEKLSSDEVKQQLETVNELYDVNLKIKKMYIVDVKMTMTVKANGKSENQDQDATFLVGKVGSNWYVVAES